MSFFHFHHFLAMQHQIHWYQKIEEPTKNILENFKCKILSKETRILLKITD